MLLLLLLLLSKEKNSVALVFFAVRETVWYVAMYYLWTAFCSLPES